MNIAIGSAFRNSAWRVPEYLVQVVALQTFIEDPVRVIAVEGDSCDHTHEVLVAVGRAACIPTEVVTLNHGGPIYGSTEQPERMTALSMVGNAIFNSVRPDDEVLVYVESDLLWDPETILALILNLSVYPEFDVVSPLIFAGELFYDTWAFRKDGERFSGVPPYHSQLADSGLTEVDSVGSCLVMNAEVARKIRIPAGQALVGWCHEAREAGYRIGVDPSLRVRHPA